jgi:arylamine N-acetyltransferase
VTSDDIAAPFGKLTLLNDTLRSYFPGCEVEEIKLETEAERLRVLREEFGLGNLPSGAEATIRKKGLALP